MINQEIEKILKKYSIKEGKNIKVVLGKFDFDDNTPNDENVCSDDNPYNEGIYKGIVFDGEEYSNDISDYYIKIFGEKNMYLSIDNIKIICLERNIDNKNIFMSLNKTHLKTMLEKIFNLISSVTAPLLNASSKKSLKRSSSSKKSLKSSSSSKKSSLYDEIKYNYFSDEEFSNLISSIQLRLDEIKNMTEKQINKLNIDNYFYLLPKHVILSYPPNAWSFSNGRHLTKEQETILNNVFIKQINDVIDIVYFTEKEFKELQESIEKRKREIKKMNNIQIKNLKLVDYYPKTILSYPSYSNFEFSNGKRLNKIDEKEFVLINQEFLNYISNLKSDITESNSRIGYVYKKKNIQLYIKNIPKDKDKKYFYGGENYNLALSIFKYNYSDYPCECIKKTKINYYKMNVDFQKTLLNYIKDENSMCEKNGDGLNIKYLEDSLIKDRIVFVLFNCSQNVLHSIATVKIYDTNPALEIEAFCVNQLEKQVGGSVLLSIIISFGIEINKSEIKLKSVASAVGFYKKNGFEFDGGNNTSGRGVSDMVLKLKPKSSTSLSYSKSGGSDKHNMYVDIPHAYYSDIVENNKDIILTKKNYSNYSEIVH